MITQKFVSVKTIIAKLYRDLRLTDEEVFTDIIEWCAEALDFIHVSVMYENKNECLEVDNYKVELPYDFVEMIAVAHNGSSLTYSTSLTNQLELPKGRMPYSSNMDRLRGTQALDPYCTHSIGRETIKVENGYIKTSFNRGKLDIVYSGLVTDEDGYPMILDNVSFKEALFWYCNYKILYGKAIRGEVNAQFYTDAYNKWQWYCGQAGAEAMMPDLMTLENIKRSFIAPRPNLNKFNNFFNS